MMIARLRCSVPFVHSRGIVVMPHKLQSPFYKPAPESLLLQKRKRPRQAKWDDPDYIYPVQTVCPTAKTGKNLIAQLEEEERKRLEYRKKEVPNIRTGDVLRFGYYRSIAGKKLLHLEGLVIQTSHRNSLKASCTVLMNYHLCETEMKVRLYSPLVAYVRIVKYGAGILRKRLGYITKTGIKPSLTHEPILKKNDHSKRIPADYQGELSPASEDPQEVSDTE